MGKNEHLAWAKQRALDLAAMGEVEAAITSLNSDLVKHSELRQHEAINLGNRLLILGQISTPEEAAHFINGVF